MYCRFAGEVIAGIIPIFWPPDCATFQAKGLRVTVVLVSGLVALGTVFRLSPLLTDDSTVFLATSHVCAILNGVSGVTIMAAPAFISSLWFPVSERTTATSISQVPS